VSRRRVLAATGTGAAGLAVLAACKNKNGGNAGKTPGQTPSGTPKPGGRYQQATAVISDALFGLDPHLAIAAGLQYFAQMYNVLMNRSAVNADYLLMDLAEHYEPVDDKTHLFTIRPGVKIAPNDLGIPERDMDAQDAWTTFERIKHQPLANSCQFVCQYFAEHKVVGTNQYQVATPVPYAWFQQNIGRAISTIPPREVIAADWSAPKIINAGAGGGPFFIRPGSFVEGEKVSLDRNPNYYKLATDGKPYLEGWDVIVIQDRQALQSAFISEQSYQYGAATDAEVDQLTSAHDVYKASNDPTYTYIALTMNVTKPPWDDPRIRKAANFALNRQEYVERVYQGAAGVNGIVHWPVAGALDPADLDKYQPFDLNQAKQLIHDATGQDTVDINVMFPSNSTIEEHQDHLPIFIRQMEAAGFKVKQDGRDLGSWLNDYRNKDYECSLALNQIYETAEIPLDFQHSKGPAGSEIYATGMQDTDIDAKIDATKHITDFDERVAAIKEVQKAIYEKGPAHLPLVTPYSRTLYWNYVKNVPESLGTTGLFLTDGIWLDKA
jgi:peptide/nickel transport system substrate-binding protein